MKKHVRRRTGAWLAGAALLCGVAASVCGGARFLPVQEDAVQAAAPAQERILIPGGQAVGVALKTQGVLVVAKSAGESVKTALCVGDVITSVDGERVESASTLSALVGAAERDVLTLEVMRGGRRISVEAAAPADQADGKRRLGVWVRDSTAGVGTLSYIDPQTGAYGALGHAIVDADTGSVLSVQDGAILAADVVGVTKGRSGKAGELRGSFLKENEQIGSLELNSPRGIYGTISKMPERQLYPQGLPLGSRDSVHEGAATMISTVHGEEIEEYSIEILKCYRQEKNGQKDMLLRVTDARLLEKTGGIVQGMSGSPIIQDGKLVGAVTHVLVNDPTKGYGIFLENMLAAAG